jgi:hypothetical protein
MKEEQRKGERRKETGKYEDKKGRLLISKFCSSCLGVMMFSVFCLVCYREHQ